MMNRKLYGLIFILSISLFFNSCATQPPLRVTYFKEVVNEANQDDITKRLGPPHLVRDLDSGEEVWVYQSRGTFIYERYGETVCTEYILTFDQNKILREWVRQSC